MAAEAAGVVVELGGRLAADARIGSYRVRALIGEGAMGEVYLADDLVLGRRVALKLVRTGGLDSRLVDRFFEEARATAAFAHPHIVTLYAVGSHDGRPYLALEFLDGESLRARLGKGPFSVRDALRTIRAITEAVAEAHGRSILHADLKPENVMLPRDGRLRVVDFGLARLAGGSGTAASGTPSYMAPERWSGAPPTEAIDVWSLGVMLFELCTGTRPWTDAELSRLVFGRGDPPLPDTDATWMPVVRACLARSPADRPSSPRLAQWLSELLEPARGSVGDAACPFPGLTAFRRDDSAHFFGRAAELDLVIESLRRHALVPIAGASGVGKSSFVCAAVVPRLEEDGRWIAITCRPGAAPFAAVAAALGHDDAAGLRAEPSRLALALAACAVRSGRHVLLVIDQFEECFTLAGDDGDALCTALAEAARVDEPWRVVLTVRDDFLARLAVTVAMRPHLAALSVLAPMTRADLRTAVVGPLGNVGYTLDHEPLAGRIAGDVDGQPASLALLQFACRALWERRDPEARHVRTGDYEALGGAAGALATHAERVLADLSPAQVKQVRAVFLELIGADGTSRPRPRRAFEAGDDGDARDVVELLIARRLVVASRQPDDGGAQIEIAHETLATAWPRLGRWLDETHEERLLATELEQASDLWARRGRRDEETWTDPALTETLRKVDAWNIELPARSRSFLDAGVARASRRRRVRRWLFSGGVGFLALIATGAVVVAVREVRQRESMALAAADMGKFQLELTAFDWDDRVQQPRPPARPPALAWKLRASSPAALDEPGRVYAEGADLRRSPWHLRDGVQVETVEARSGRVFLEVDRGDCAPSVIAIQRLPGYTERARPATIRVNVPTCAATAAGMVEVLAGAFWRSVDGDDGTTSHDELADLATYRIDRTEVTRRAFAMYDAARDLTNDDVASTTVMDRRNDTRADLPIAAISYATARNYCRFMGKQLPTVEQWQKAVRGGVAIAGEPNPEPRRLQVWPESLAEPRVAISREGADIEVMPVGSSPDDRSVYDIVDLAGNLSEWTTTIADKGPFAGLRVAVGSNWSEYLSHRHYRVSWRNAHPDQYISYSLGVRCVAPP